MKVVCTCVLVLCGVGLLAGALLVVIVGGVRTLLGRGVQRG